MTIYKQLFTTLCVLTSLCLATDNDDRMDIEPAQQSIQQALPSLQPHIDQTVTTGNLGFLREAIRVCNDPQELYTFARFYSTVPQGPLFCFARAAYYKSLYLHALNRSRS